MCRKRHSRPPDTRQRSRPDRVRTKARKRVGGVDGETIDNAYVLLVAATDDGFVARAENPKGLSTRECLGFLTRLPKDVVWWGFAFRYDVNMMLGDVPWKLIERLQTEGSCYWGAYRLEYHGRKLLVSRYEGSGKHRRVAASFTLWDMYPWVQTSFVRWLRKWQLAPERTIRRVDEMKNLRSSFAPSQRAAIRRYCTQECKLLAAGARRLMDLIAVTGLPVNVYNSPASVAKAAMKRHKVIDHAAPPPSGCAGHVEAAYFGGRAEVSELGLIDGPFYAYDLNSAYPAVAVNLPCLRCGGWRHTERPGTWSKYSLLKVSWRARQGVTWGPFPLQPKVGSLRYPTAGSGWYWSVEVDAAIRKGFKVEVSEAWEYDVGCDHQPFAYLREMYDLRKRLQADDDESQIVYKLALNSTYGALAEHPHKRNGRVEIPRYRNMVWAGLVTAGVRAQLLDVLTDDVMFLATDCAVSRSPLQVPIGDDLGLWGHDPAKDVYDRMLIFGTGQYFKSVGGAWTSDVKTRGFNPREIDRDALEALWVARGREGVYTFNRQRFVGYGTALRRIGGMWPPMSRLWRTFVTERVVKRYDLSPRRTWKTADVMDGRTVAPTLTLHRQTAKADADALALWYRRYDEARATLERMYTRRNPKGELSPFIPIYERKVWLAMLAITGMSGSPDHERLFPFDAEPVAWGDDW